MDINTFELFLKCQKDGFESFLKGCQDLDRAEMRTALNTHNIKMTFALSTEFPLLGGRSVSSPFKSPTPRRSPKQTSPSPFKSPTPTSFRSSSPPGSNRPFRVPSSVPEFTHLPSMFKRTARSTSATPANTPTSKKSADPESSKRSPYGRFPSSSRGSMTIGGAGRLFSSVIRKGRSNTIADDSDSSDGSTAESDSKTIRTPNSKKVKASPAKTPISPFEVAARKAEIESASKARRLSYYKSESTSDFEISIPSKSTVHKVGYAKSEMEKFTTPKKDLEKMDAEGMYAKYGKDEDMWEGTGQVDKTPSKKRKTEANGGSGQKSSIGID